MNTGDKQIRYGKYIDNKILETPGIWRVYLRVIDNCSNTAEIYSTIIVDMQKGLNVTLYAKPIFGYAPLKVAYEGFAFGGTQPYQYNWTFGNGDTGYGKIIDTLFEVPGVYTTKLVAKDTDGRYGEATVAIKVLPRDCSQDGDKDGVFDCDDLCPLVSGGIVNKGCPILEQFCSLDFSCPTGFTCSSTNKSVYSQSICVPEVKIKNTCLYNSSKDSIFGNVTCNSCPCSGFVDFISTLRKCDTIFPAITSPDSTEIYSQGSTYQIQ